MVVTQAVKMFIEQVHGLHATSISLSERFTLLASAAPDRVGMSAKPRPIRPTIGSFLNQDLNIHNRFLIEQIARRLQQQAKKRALRARLGRSQGQGMPNYGLRTYGSESNLPGLRRANSYGNLNGRNRGSWGQNNSNLSRAASFSNLSQGGWRGRFRRRGGPRVRGRMRRGGRVAGGAGGRVQRTGGQGRGRGRSRGRGARGQRIGLAAARMTRLQAKLQALPSKEELDAQLDQYMSTSAAALDKQLEAYMSQAGDPEVIMAE